MPVGILEKMCWIDMLQIVFSFCAGVYVGTEYDMLPYVDKVKSTLATIEKKEKPSEEEEPKQSSSSWFFWGNKSKESWKKNYYFYLYIIAKV